MLWNLPRRSLELSSRVRKFAVDPVCIFSCCCDTCKLIFFYGGVHGAPVCCAIVSPVEDGSVRWEGPANILALSSFVCPYIC